MLRPARRKARRHEQCSLTCQLVQTPPALTHAVRSDGVCSSAESPAEH